MPRPTTTPDAGQTWDKAEVQAPDFVYQRARVEVTDTNEVIVKDRLNNVIATYQLAADPEMPEPDHLIGRVGVGSYLTVITDSSCACQGFRKVAR